MVLNRQRVGVQDLNRFAVGFPQRKPPGLEVTRAVAVTLTWVKKGNDVTRPVLSETQRVTRPVTGSGFPALLRHRTCLATSQAFAPIKRGSGHSRPSREALCGMPNAAPHAPRVRDSQTGQS